MKITDILAEGRLTLSFEVFPPKTDATYDSIREATEEIAAIRPHFMSVTCGAGGNSPQNSGYTVDIARNLQTRHKQWYVGKSMDGFTPIGPCIVTADEIEDVQNLDIKSFVNGELRQNSNTKYMIQTVAGAISVAGYTLIGKEMRKSMTTTAYTYIVYATCAFVLVVTTLFQGYGIRDFSFRTIGAGFFLGVVSTILGHSVFSWCLKYFTPSFVSGARLLEPVIASIVAIFLFQEIPAVMQVLGGLIVLAGVFVYSKYEQE